MSPKDLFSQTSLNYAQFRPLYPSRLYEWVYANCKQFDQAWDCATGNGQVARELALHFKQIYATDLSLQQLNQAPQIENVHYLCEPAESSSLENESCDLITVAQAIHWFDFDKFYGQVYRILKPAGVLAIWVYEILKVREPIDFWVNELYNTVLGPYWDPERLHIENKLSSIPFPFAEIKCPEFEIRDFWSRKQFLGYIRSWSALQHYEKAKGHSAFPAFQDQISQIWPEAEVYEVRFPVYMKAGRLK